MPYLRKISKFTYFNTSRCVRSKSINGAIIAIFKLFSNKHFQTVVGDGNRNPFHSLWLSVSKK